MHSAPPHENVVCEKPMGLNGAEVEALSAAARAQGTFLMEGLWSRFLPAVVALQGVLDAGTLGEVVAVHGDFGFVCDDPPSSRMFDPALGGGGLLDIGIYPLAFASMAFKGAAPSRVAAAGTLHPATGVDTSAGITCTFPSPGGGGGQGGLSIVTYNLRGHTPEDMVFVGTKGRATLKGPAHVATTLLLTVPDGRTGAVAEEVREFPLPPRDPEHAYLYPGSEGFKFEIEEVQRCLAEKRTESPRYTHEEMVNIARTMDEVRKQLGVVYPADAHKPKIAAASAAPPPPPEVVAVAAGGHE